MLSKLTTKTAHGRGLCVLLSLGCAAVLTAQTRSNFSLKNNLLYDATLTPNLGMELRIDSLNSVQAFYGINPCKFGDAKKLRHWSLMPEYRHWAKKVFDGLFYGLHAVGGQYNAEGIGPFTTLKNNRFEGWYAGGGITAGYAWPLSLHWNLEAAVGLGYLYTSYDQYEPGECGYPLGPGHRHYVGPTKLALNIAYIFGKQKQILPPPPQVDTLPEPYRPDWHFSYVSPQAETNKVREISGRANVEFIVDKWDIVEDYRNNYAEYQKIRQSVEQVKDDPDARIIGIWLKGFASPESPYEHNTMLARNRVDAIRQYVQRLYGIPSDIITTDYEPEDWAGLRQFVEASQLEHRDEILQLIDAQTDPDRKEAQIKRQYPSEYEFMLGTWYPALRHTDYKIQYVVNNFTDPQRCLELVRTAPQKLSLNEFYLAAQACEPGSQDYNEVFETAVRMYPESEAANLNAAVSALRRGDLSTARRYAPKAGSSPEALCVQGILALKNGDPETARRLFREAGNDDARHNLQEMLRVEQR